MCLLVLMYRSAVTREEHFFFLIIIICAQCNNDCAATRDMPIIVGLVEQAMTNFSEFQQMIDVYEQLILNDGNEQRQ